MGLKWRLCSVVYNNNNNSNTKYETLLIKRKIKHGAATCWKRWKQPAKDVVLFGGVSNEENNNGHNSTLWAETGHVSVTTSWIETTNNATLDLQSLRV